MVIALLVVLGVDLAVLLAFLVVVLARRRWVMSQPGAFRGVIRVVGGDIHGLRPKWSRGYGRWVRDVFVWTKAPFLFRNELLEADGLNQERPARPNEVKRLGEEPVVIQVRASGATVELAANADAREQLLGPYRKPVGTMGSA
ncbi:DUF2550 family protein [Cryobacterium adonitolivorans]|nr:DUF2550 family protein [Cryobacterium adonitolivorans]